MAQVAPLVVDLDTTEAEAKLDRLIELARELRETLSDAQRALDTEERLQSAYSLDGELACTNYKGSGITVKIIVLQDTEPVAI